jgi:preprotein translocase subunit SecD
LEGSSWLRIGTILALFLGSLYVLLPTILQEDAASRLERKASSVEQVDKKGPDLDIRFRPEAGDGTASAAALRERLRAAKVSVERVRAAEGEVIVTLAPGGRKSQVRDLLAPGVMALHAVDAVALQADVEGEEPEEAAPEEAPDEAKEDSAGQNATLMTFLAETGADMAAWASFRCCQPTVPAGTAGLAAGSIEVSTTEDGLTLNFEKGWPSESPVLAVSLDNAVVGLALKSETDTFKLIETSDQAPARLSELSPILLGGPLAVLSEVTEEVKGDEEKVETVAEVAEPIAPDWLLGMLPDTRMNLGLDLQGGIDLTLQVELDDAVLSQAARDMAFVKERTAREGLDVISVKRSRSAPIILVEMDGGIDELRAYVQKWMGGYLYIYSEGNIHAFEMSEDRIKEVQGNAVEQVLETLRKRIDATGVKEPSIVKKGGGRINVQLPGKVDLQQAIDAIGTTAVLEFRLVDEDFDDADLERALKAARLALPEEQYESDDLLNDWLWDERRLPDDRIIQWEYEERAGGVKVRSIPIVLKSAVVITGNDINDASVGWDQNQQSYVRLEFKPRGSTTFCDISSENINKRFAIILDEEIKSAPVIRDRICGGVASIEMGAAMDPLKEANNLALVLRTGSLDAPVSIGEVRSVGSTLGKDSIRSGSIAAAAGSVIVLVFMAVWYGRAGILADIALALNVMLAMAVLSLFGATLTLPGIAGIALTVGMAVDANIIIYERIREELQLGVLPRKAVDTGFDKGVVAVLDANITTAIAGIVLFSYGTGPIKGFAVTLLIGIATTLITALFVTRTFMNSLTRNSTARLRL